jgi:Response regulators consisting of a CheY-like receiver domain and a winged-helix DNA-binding domain
MLDKLPILIAEDNKNDVALMRRAFVEAGIPNPLIVVRNGREVIEYLAGQGDYAERAKYPLPGLMLLDLKMPWMDGFDVLSWVRGQPQFAGLPVVLLTSSKLRPEEVQSRLMGVYDYRVKPHDFAELVSLLADVRKCWLDEGSNCSRRIVEVSGRDQSTNGHSGNSRPPLD